jgi:hypothetical protein
MQHTRAAQDLNDDNAYTADAFAPDEPTPVQTSSPAPAAASVASRLVRLVLVVGVAAAAAFGITKAYLYWQDGQATLAQGNLQIIDRPAPVLASPAAVQQPLQAWLVLAGRDHSLNAGQVALPNGSRFQIKLQSTQSGYLVVHTVNPEGVRSAQAIWSGAVQAGQPATSGMMRLQGARGQEALVLELLASPGGPPLAQSRFTLWHM